MLLTVGAGFPISILVVGGAPRVGDGGQLATSVGSSLYQLMSIYQHQGFPNSIKMWGGIYYQLVGT